MDEALQVMKETLTFFRDNLHAVYGIIAAVIVFIIEIKYTNAHKRVSRLDKRIAKAEEMGHVAKATRIKYHTHRRRSDDNHQSDATYRFEVDGVPYKYHYHGFAFPVTLVDVYWLNSPRHTFSKLEKEENSVFVVLYYILPLVVAALVMKLTGGI